ncbi:hypothetical protein chiPu_0021158 [Chiloscyllium punctatum]|uniref:Ig-like domain-containing protein n=1 Tax=Chiloscyllium punctatum TaxID=137246 RepID=A0A401RNQ4_CHIPU|nr:hypothetical protein [Chiloscyllium punctatum]
MTVWPDSNKPEADMSDGDSVTEREPWFAQTEGKDVTFNCTYTGNAFYLFWYRQYPGRQPEFAVRKMESSGAELKADFAQTRFFGTLQKSEKLYRLTISELVLSDTANYYCATSLTVRGVSESLVQ